MKREIVKDSSPLYKKLGDNLLKISTDSLVYKHFSDQRRGKTVRDKDKDDMSTKITDKLIKDLKNHYYA